MDQWTLEDVPLDRPNAARIYDWMLGGYHNFEIDRQLGQKMLDVYPDARLGAMANRDFLRRSVEFLIQSGVDQILDVGSGIPTAGNVHEVAQSLNPEARVVYVDIDPVAVSHSLSLLVDNPNATAVRADIRQAEVILGAGEVRDMLDFGRPVGLLLITVLHYLVDDDEARTTVQSYRQALVPGSHLVISHGATGYDTPESIKVAEVFGTASRTRSRSHEQVATFFEGFEMVEPGLVLAPLWKPEGTDGILFDRPEASLSLVGVGRKV